MKQPELAVAASARTDLDAPALPPHRSVSLLDAAVPHNVQDTHADVVTVATTTGQTSQGQSGIETCPGVRAGASLHMGMWWWVGVEGGVQRRGGRGSAGHGCLSIKLTCCASWNGVMREHKAVVWCGCCECRVQPRCAAPRCVIWPYLVCHTSRDDFLHPGDVLQPAAGSSSSSDSSNTPSCSIVCGGGIVTRRHVGSHAAACSLWIKPLTMWLKMGTNVLFSNVEHVHT
jgi:hypothetical protein